MTLCIAWLHARDAAELIAHWATPEDHAHATGRRPEKANETLAARAVLRGMVSRATGGDAWHIQTDPNGKPLLRSNGTMPAPSISLSHSNGVVAAAIGPPGMALGVDIERHKLRDFNALAAYAFGPTERAQVAAEGAAAFYRIWTAREARAKAIGSGFKAVLDEGDRVGPGISARRWLWENFHFQHSFPTDGYSLTVASNTTLPSPIEILAHSTLLKVSAARCSGER